MSVTPREWLRPPRLRTLAAEEALERLREVAS
jgi:hypothetical protein